MGNESSTDSGSEGEPSGTQLRRASDEKIRYDREFLEIYHSGNVATQEKALASTRNHVDQEASSSKADPAPDNSHAEAGCVDIAGGNPGSVGSETDTVVAEGTAERPTEHADSAPPTGRIEVGSSSPNLPSSARRSPALRLSADRSEPELVEQDEDETGRQSSATLEAAAEKTPPPPPPPPPSLDEKEKLLHLLSSSSGSAGPRESLRTQDAQCAPTAALPESLGESPRSPVKRRSVAEEILSTETL